jgi:hypothetical protein
MYQRYYKQRKFGRIFSFCMVVGSGLSHYIKSSYKFVKTSFSFDNIVKYEEYLPNNLKTIVENIKEMKTIENIKDNTKDIFSNKKEKLFLLKSNYWIYKTNLDNGTSNRSKFDFKNFQKLDKNQILNTETFELYKYFNKNKKTD